MLGSVVARLGSQIIAKHAANQGGLTSFAASTKPTAITILKENVGRFHENVRILARHPVNRFVVERVAAVPAP